MVQGVGIALLLICSIVIWASGQFSGLAEGADDVSDRFAPRTQVAALLVPVALCYSPHSLQIFRTAQLFDDKSNQLAATIFSAHNYATVAVSAFCSFCLGHLPDKLGLYNLHIWACLSFAWDQCCNHKSLVYSNASSAYV